MKSYILSAIILMLSGTVFGGVWTADTSHSLVGFKVKHMMLSNTNGKFNDFSATLTTDDKEKLMAVDTTIQAKSLDTTNEKRDAHLRSVDFFDTEKFPTITFRTKKITAVKKGTFKLVGELTMHGVTKELTFDADMTDAIKDPTGMQRRAFSASTKINRKDWGLSWNKTLDNGGVAVGDTVDVNLDLEFTSGAKAAAPTKS